MTMPTATAPPKQDIPPDPFVPRDDPKQRPLGEPPEPPSGIGDPRTLPGQEIVEPIAPDFPATPPIPDLDEPGRGHGSFLLSR